MRKIGKNIVDIGDVKENVKVRRRGEGMMRRVRGTLAHGLRRTRRRVDIRFARPLRRSSIRPLV